MSEQPIKQYKWLEDVKNTILSHEFQAAYMASTAVSLTLAVLKKRFMPRLITQFPILKGIVGRVKLTNSPFGRILR